jgi:hypothetical protein
MYSCFNNQYCLLLRAGIVQSVLRTAGISDLLTISDCAFCICGVLCDSHCIQGLFP